MKKIFAFVFISTIIFARSIISPWGSYRPPWDTDVPQKINYQSPASTLGEFARYMDVIALAEVVEDNGPTSGFKFGSIKVRVVNPVYGCTNGQEFVMAKGDNSEYNYPDMQVDFYPTNNSRIVFAVSTNNINHFKPWTSQTWKNQASPEKIMSQIHLSIPYPDFSRSWWYENFYNGIPYAQLTNLVRVTRFERNWTNYYHLCRDNIPNPSAPRVEHSAYVDLVRMMFLASDSQLDFIFNDPLLLDEFRKNEIGIREAIFKNNQRPEFIELIKQESTD